MLLYSIACGVSCVGVLFILIVAYLMFIHAQFAGYPLGLFKTRYGFEWGTLFLATFAIFGTTAGIATVVSLGYQPVDPFVLIITGVATFIVNVVIYWMLHALGDKSPRKKNTA